jgi:starch synthase (maltosyl-transferring)
MIWRQFSKDDRVMNLTQSTQPYRLSHIVIEAVTPTVDCARYPVKRAAGESCVVEADIFGNGPAALAAVIRWRRAQDESFVEAPMALFDNDRWREEFPLAENTRYVFIIEAWTRAFFSWREYFVKKTAAGLNVDSDLAEGIALLEKIRMRAGAAEHILIADYVARIRALKDPR